MNTSITGPLQQKQEDDSYDAWFKEQVDLAVREADSPDAEWTPSTEAKANWQKKRAEYLQSTGIKS
ncbi:hypothetical protein DIC66_04400 [Rhodoferax lacus]|uniref:Stability determinant n=1 Tax=Rhodoferax lacus TaxID=2184758 RepID=A0A3E1RG24_9BURK|nr:hypothetical protein [Rhodoferax lacus]RFO97972.1 hypothetical protein DIC66_04400 [Rhodoferax lacus]